MAGMQRIVWPGIPPDDYYLLQVEPLGWFQRHIRWLPFLKDTKPIFRLTVTCRQANVPAQTLTWFIMFENDKRTGGDIQLPPMTLGKQESHLIGDRLLGYGGDTILGVDAPRGTFQALLSFWSLRGETVLYGAVLSLLSALVGAGLTYLVTL